MAAGVGSSEVRLISPQREAQLFGRLRRRTFQAHVRGWIEESLLRLAVISVLCLVFWIALFASFAEGFQLLETAIAHVPTRATTVQHVFNVFFLTLLAMLTVSSAVIFYGVVFRGEETRVLLTLPATAQRIVLYKLQETTLFSCWGFLLIGSPMLIAYGIVAAAPWYYYVMLPPFVVAFVTIPTSVGALLCLGGAYLMPSLRVHAMTILCVCGLLALLAFGWLLLAAQSEDMLTAEWLSRMNHRLRFAEQRLLPSWWLSAGLLEAAHAHSGPLKYAWSSSVLLLGVLISNALLFSLLAAKVGGRLLRPAYGRISSVVAARRKGGTSRLDRIVEWGLFPFTAPMRRLLIKDFRTFRRDPVQWSQFLIFFGLL
ncbi:MAG: hypothetical protein KDA41_11690, partial [Planctomycetales bacterium]|nr:hypothetical protein [Planctomycetales bacterium]